jgi:replicative DNA helicase
MKDEIKNKTIYKNKLSSVNSMKLDQGLGKLPPQALDLEEAVLGAIMLERDALTSVIEDLQPRMFYKDANQRIYNAIQRLFADNEPIDILTVSNKLKSSGELEMVGGYVYLATLTKRVSSSANIEYHARIIIEKYIQRELISMSSGIITKAYEDTTDVLDLLDTAQNDLFNLVESNFKRGIRPILEVIGQAIEQIEMAKKNKSGISGVPTGFTRLDQVTGGFQNSDLLILAARPGVGKTALALSFLRNMAIKYKRPVAFFSLEMPAAQLVMRLMSAEAEIPSENLRTGRVSDTEMEILNDNLQKLSDAPIYIDDTAGLTLFELRAKCRRLKTQYDIQFVAIDYLQLMSGGEGAGYNREQQISSISRGLKALAKELNIPILALSQLSRKVEERGGEKKPQLSDLRESGAIEQDADIVMFIYRPDYYNEATEGSEGFTELCIAKHRNGRTEDIPIQFISKYVKFTDASLDFNTFGVNGEPDMYQDLSGNQYVQTYQSRMNDDFGDDFNDDFNDDLSDNNNSLSF